MSLGASQNVSIIKPLAAAITFHQLLLGIGRGGCISQAKFGLKKRLVMALVFCLTTPVGIGIGIGFSEIYYENGPTMLMVSGFLKAAAAGILLFTGVVTLRGLRVLNRVDMLLVFLNVFILLPFPITKF
ncbi:unnamed protein product [Microthlaspi erraticum]|uniref:Uncharacterized protein n=1 Tax=Microthlaspi erraticum TaxID=1685480 RepID=A0A6D2J0P3_9BRAS|nr:unnamed protein product [Microthlaspi erraticum]